MKIMPKTTYSFCLSLLLCGLSGNGLAAETRAPLYGMDDPNRIPESYIVVMKDGNQSRASLSALSTLEGLCLISQYAMKGFQGFAAIVTDTALEQIRKNPNVAYVEADSIITLITRMPLR